MMNLSVSSVVKINFNPPVTVKLYSPKAMPVVYDLIANPDFDILFNMW